MNADSARIRDAIFYILITVFVLACCVLLYDGRELDRPYAERVRVAIAVEETLPAQIETPAQAQEIAVVAVVEDTTPEPTPEPISLGTFKLYAYCPCKKCCGPNAQGITASGTTATARRTISVDPKAIPLGSTVIINGHEYIAEDTGSGIKGNTIDVFMDSHQDALEFGVQYAEVFIKE